MATDVTRCVAEMLGGRLHVLAQREFGRRLPSTTISRASPKRAGASDPAFRNSGFWRDRNGAGAIEFAIVAPLFLLIVLGLLVYGMYLGSAHSVEQLAANAARASVAGLTDAERVQIATDHIATNTPDYPLLDAAKVSVVAGPSPLDPTQFRVSVRFDASDLPIWAMSGLVPMPDRIIERTSVIKRGGF